MTDMRPVSSSTAAAASASASLPPDLNNINGLTNYVNTIFQQMEDKFTTASDQVINRMNELGQRIDTLETNIGDIISHLPTEETTVSSHSTKTTQQQQIK